MYAMLLGAWLSGQAASPFLTLPGLDRSHVAAVLKEEPKSHFYQTGSYFNTFYIKSRLVVTYGVDGKATQVTRLTLPVVDAR